MTDLVKAIQKIARLNPKGFTVTIPDLQHLERGWAIGHKETQRSFGTKGLKKVIEHSMRTTKVVGGWKGYDGRYYFDTVIIEHDIDKAIDLKVKHGQICIFNLETGKVR